MEPINPEEFNDAEFTVLFIAACVLALALACLVAF